MIAYVIQTNTNTFVTDLWRPDIKGYVPQDIYMCGETQTQQTVIYNLFIICIFVLVFVLLRYEITIAILKFEIISK